MERLEFPVGWVDIPLHLLVKASWNYKEEDDFIASKLLNNIAKNKQLVNIIVRELDDGKFEICNGNHRYDPFVKLGYETVHCYNLGKNISLPQAQRIAIETNETNFPNDPLKLSTTIKNIVEEFTLFDVEATLPYDKSTTVEFLKLAEFSWDEFKNKDDSGHLDHTHKSADAGVAIKKPTIHTCPECGHSWEENVVVAPKASKSELQALDEIDLEFE